MSNGLLPLQAFSIGLSSEAGEGGAEGLPVGLLCACWCDMGSPDRDDMEEVKRTINTLISEKRRNASPDAGSSWQQAFDASFQFLDRLGIRERLNALKVIHIAGTKVSATRTGDRGVATAKVTSD